ncbi:MAG: arylesterase [Gammaproteobacteria bacterium]|nr:arylesterase [Gammaproteobacteria bacterium]
MKPRPRQGCTSAAWRLLPVLVLTGLLAAACGESSSRLAPLAPGAVVLAFGDSLTYGTGAGPGEDYPSRLAELGSLTVINAGVPGETSEEGLARLPALLEQHDPDVVVLWHGGNDLLQRRDATLIEINIRRMVNLSRDAGAEVVLVGVPGRNVLLDVAPLYPAIARDEALPFVENVLKPVLRDPALKADSVHPNGAGYRQIAKEIYELFE